MFRLLLFILLIYLVYRFIRNLSIFTVGSRRTRQEDPVEPPPAPKQNKIIEKNEGEYVDYEEIK